MIVHETELVQAVRYFRVHGLSYFAVGRLNYSQELILVDLNVGAQYRPAAAVLGDVILVDLADLTVLQVGLRVILRLGSVDVLGTGLLLTA